MPRKNDPAPHGYDDEGKPKAPYGLNTDGTPRKSRRGPVAGRRVSSPAVDRPKVEVSSKSDKERKGMLLQLADAFLVTPLANFSKTPFLGKKIGKHADALAGDALILAHYGPALADAAILMSKDRPGLLSWLDKAEQNAPWLMLAQVGIQVAKSIAENHINPDPAMAAAGRNLAQMRMQQMAAEVNAEAERIAEEAAMAARIAGAFGDEPTAPIG